MVEVSTESTVSRLPDSLCTEVDGEAVLMNVDSGRYFGLDGTGTTIWNRIEEPCKIGDLIGLMMSEYEDESGEIEADVLAFLAHMADERLIEVAQ